MGAQLPGFTSWLYIQNFKTEFLFCLSSLFCSLEEGSSQPLPSCLSLPLALRFAQPPFFLPACTAVSSETGPVLSCLPKEEHMEGYFGQYLKSSHDHKHIMSSLNVITFTNKEHRMKVTNLAVVSNRCMKLMLIYHI